MSGEGLSPRVSQETEMSRTKTAQDALRLTATSEESLDFESAERSAEKVKCVLGGIEWPGRLLPWRESASWSAKRRAEE